ncbi:hypothetical protein IPG41_04975 [Candidatus Peregrinibacteria bacterium]|nr:MAG: hypothetical protein IPG41_04975 [Candidatus Peregrinibacteria bacterium]
MSLLLLSLLLSACGGPQVADYANGSLTYDSSIWNYNAERMLLVAKKDETCWVNLTGGNPSDILPGSLTDKDAVVNEGVTLYKTSTGDVPFASFEKDGNTFYALTGGMDLSQDLCIGYVSALANAN